MKRRIFCCFITCMVILLSACTKEGTVYLESDTQEEQSEDHSESSGAQPASCYVYICGEVVSPGVYEVEEDARICDVLALAGGYTDKAAAESVNLAEPVEDGRMIRILSEEELETGAMDTPAGQIASEKADSRVNLNQAGMEELMTLPGIGESKAQSIIDYRTEHNGFEKIEDLMNIPGIKSGVFEKIKDSIRVD